jgi:hypothetical protein
MLVKVRGSDDVLSTTPRGPNATVDEKQHSTEQKKGSEVAERGYNYGDSSALLAI